MRIALLASPYVEVPPRRYGGAELVVANLAHELTRLGHRVTVFASGDSAPAGRLRSVFPTALYPAGVPWNDPLRSMLHATAAFDRADQYDVIHNHFSYYGLMLSQLVRTPTLTTFHGDFAAVRREPDRRRILEHFRRSPFVAISAAQRAGCPLPLRFVGTVHNGIQVDRFRFQARPGRYLAWLGRITPKKGILEAIAVARRLRLPLQIGAKIDPVDEPFFRAKIRRRIDGRAVRYLGEVDHPRKVTLLGGALALLNPVQWEEPFGLVMIEAMACGTPVVAFDRGAIREVVRDGITGFVVPSATAMVRAVRKVGSLSRAACRAHVERHFTAQQMAQAYVRVYARILRQHRKRKT